MSPATALRWTSFYTRKYAHTISLATLRLRVHKEKPWRSVQAKHTDRPKHFISADWFILDPVHVALDALRARDAMMRCGGCE